MKHAEARRRRNGDANSRSLFLLTGFSALTFAHLETRQRQLAIAIQENSKLTFVCFDLRIFEITMLVVQKVACTDT